MADPFGAIHNQNIGDIGVFAGAGSWAASGFMVNVNPATGKMSLKTEATDTIDPNSVTRNAVTGGDKVEINQGSSAAPVLAQGATLYVSRYANMTSGGDSNAAIFASHYNNGATQPVGVFAEVTQDGAGDACGFYSYTRQNNGSHAAFGAFLHAEATAAGGGGISLETLVTNGTGANSAYTTGTFVGWDASYVGGAGANYGGAVIQVRGNPAAGGDRWDAVLYVAGDSVRSYIVDASAATTATSWHGKFSVDNDIQITRATSAVYFQHFIGTGTGANTWAIAIESGATPVAGAIGFDDLTAVVQSFYIAPGNPAAGNTSIWLRQGATPALSQIKYFNDGAGHNVLYF